MIVPQREYSLRLLCLMLIPLCAALTGFAAGGTASSLMSGSILGFVWDPQAHNLRPVLGLPGSSYLGKTSPLGVDLADAAVSPSGDYALGITRDRLTMVEIRHLAGSVTVREVLRHASPIDAVFISRNGTTAAVYRRRPNTYQILTHLPDAPAAGSELELPASHGPLTALAVRSAGPELLAGFSNGESGAIYLLDSRGARRIVSLIEHPSAIAFLTGERDALVADHADNGVFLVRNISTNVATFRLASRTDGVDGPVAVAVSRDGKYGYVANASSKTILTLEFAGGPPVLHSCHCTPATLSPMNGNAVFRLTDPSQAPMWLFDGDARTPRIVFVPPYRPSAGLDSPHRLSYETPSLDRRNGEFAPFQPANIRESRDQQ